MFSLHFKSRPWLIRYDRRFLGNGEILARFLEPLFPVPPVGDADVIKYECFLRGFRICVIFALKVSFVNCRSFCAAVPRRIKASAYCHPEILRPGARVPPLSTLEASCPRHRYRFGPKDVPILFFKAIVLT